MEDTSSCHGGFDPGFSDMAAESLWDPCGPHMSVNPHPLLSLFSLSSFSSATGDRTERRLPEQAGRAPLP